jgi:hypothetical protein
MSGYSQVYTPASLVVEEITRWDVVQVDAWIVVVSGCGGGDGWGGEGVVVAVGYVG